MRSVGLVGCRRRVRRSCEMFKTYFNVDVFFSVLGSEVKSEHDKRVHIRKGIHSHCHKHRQPWQSRLQAVSSGSSHFKGRSEAASCLWRSLWAGHFNAPSKPQHPKIRVRGKRILSDSNSQQPQYGYMVHLSVLQGSKRFTAVSTKQHAGIKTRRREIHPHVSLLVRRYRSGLLRHTDVRMGRKVECAHVFGTIHSTGELRLFDSRLSPSRGYRCCSSCDLTPAFFQPVFSCPQTTVSGRQNLRQDGLSKPQDRLNRFMALRTHQIPSKGLRLEARLRN